MSIVDDLTKPSLSVNVVKGSTKSFTRYSTSCDSISVHSQFDGPLDISKNMSMGKALFQVEEITCILVYLLSSFKGIAKRMVFLCPKRLGAKEIFLLVTICPFEGSENKTALPLAR